MSILRGPIGRGRPGPGLNVDERHALRLDGGVNRAKRRRLCDVYEHCYGLPGGPLPAVVEVTTVYRLPGSQVWHLLITRHCVRCFRLSQRDHWALWRKNRADVGGSVIVRQPRKVWLTTLVNGEVPA